MSFIVTVIIIMILDFTWTNIVKIRHVSEEQKVFIQNIDNNNTTINNEDEQKSNNESDIDVTNNTLNYIEDTNEIENKQIAELQIPAISLKAPIAEGTTKEIMDKYVGHFENTSLWNGNIGLAAHNRGYLVNYFSNIKELQIGDEIIYISATGTRTYLANEINIIEDTNWLYLQATEDNRITLITCVENEPSYRRCIQGIQKINEYETRKEVKQ